MPPAGFGPGNYYSSVLTARIEAAMNMQISHGCRKLNPSNINVGGINVTRKGGDYMWVRYEDKADGDNW